MKRPLIINFKNYEEVSAEGTVRLARAAQKVSERMKVEIVVAPPQPALPYATPLQRLPLHPVLLLRQLRALLLR